MKNILLDIFYIGILLVVASCSPSSPSGYSRYGVFPETDEVTVGETALDSVYFRYPYRVEIGNGLAVCWICTTIVIICMLLPILMAACRAFRETWGRAGRVAIRRSGAVVCAGFGLGVGCQSDANHALVSRCGEPEVSRAETVSLDKRLLRTLDFCKTANGFLVDDYTGEHRFHEIGIDGRIIRSMGAVPTEDEGKRENPMALAKLGAVSWIMIRKEGCWPSRPNWAKCLKSTI